MDPLIPSEYQEDGINEITNHFEKHYKILAVNYPYGSGKTVMVSIAANNISPNNFFIFAPTHVIPYWISVLGRLNLSPTKISPKQDMKYGNGIHIAPLKLYTYVLKITSPLVIIDESGTVPNIYRHYNGTYDEYGKNIILINHPNFISEVHQFSLPYPIPSIELKMHRKESQFIRMARELQFRIPSRLVLMSFDNINVKPVLMSALEKWFLNYSIMANIPYRLDKTPTPMMLTWTPLQKFECTIDLLNTHLSRFRQVYRDAKSMIEDIVIEKRINLLLSLVETWKENKIIITTHKPILVEEILSVSDIPFLTL